MNSEQAKTELESFLHSHPEWLLIYCSSGKSFSLQAREIEITVEREKLFLGFLGETGFQTWRVNACQSTGENEKISFELTRNFGRENEKISLVPRVSALDLSRTAELARIEKARKLADLVVQANPKTKLIRAELNRETGRFAQIIIEDFRGRQFAVVADVSDSLAPEILLSTAILWLEKLRARKKNSVENVWILVEKKRAKSLSDLCALLRENWKRAIKIFQILRAETSKEQRAELKEIPALSIYDLWRKKAPKIQTIETSAPSETARKILAFAPDEIDFVFSRNGETLRFRGLPFARVRKISGAERMWFGIEKSKQILSEKNFDELIKLIDELRIYRRFDSPNKHHAFYRLAPESWLEALLRKNIKRLDANLILSPLYHQFRTEREKIDLLALRRDNRLVIIELKVAPDRETVFQAVDYWRKIELQRRKGNLEKAKIFGDLEILDAPALVYLVAPSLSFHKDLDFLAQTAAPEIEIFRFFLNENWRREIKVLERK